MSNQSSNCISREPTLHRAPPCSDLCKRAGSRRDWGYNCVTVIVGLCGLCSRADGPSPACLGVWGRGPEGRNNRTRDYRAKLPAPDPSWGGQRVRAHGPAASAESSISCLPDQESGPACGAPPVLGPVCPVWSDVSRPIRRNEAGAGMFPWGGGGLFTGSSPRLSLVSWMIVWRKSRPADKCPAQD